MSATLPPDERVRAGRPWLQLALVLNAAALVAVLATAPTALRAPLAIVALIMALVGLFRTTPAMGYSPWSLLLLTVSQLLPFLNLLVLIFINGRVTVFLRKHGYSVSALGGAKKNA